MFAIGGVLSQVVVIAYASRSLRISQRRYCTTRREMLAAVVMCTHFRSYLRGSQFTLRTDHSSLRWLQKFKNEDGMLARWYLLLGQLHSSTDRDLYIRMPTGFLGNVVSVGDRTARYPRPTCRQLKLKLSRYWLISRLLHQKWVIQWTQTLPELSGETWVASALLEELTWDLLTAGSDIDLAAASRGDKILQMVRS